VTKIAATNTVEGSQSTSTESSSIATTSGEVVEQAALTYRYAEEGQEAVTNAIALHHTPGVGLDHGPEAFLLSAGAAVDVFGLRSNHVPDAVRATVVQQYPRLGFKREFAELFRAEARQVPHGRAWYLHRFAISDVTIRLAPFPG